MSPIVTYLSLLLLKERLIVGSNIFLASKKYHPNHLNDPELRKGFLCQKDKKEL